MSVSSKSKTLNICLSGMLALCCKCWGSSSASAADSQSQVANLLVLIYKVCSWSQYEGIHKNSDQPSCLQLSLCATAQGWMFSTIMLYNAIVEKKKKGLNCANLEKLLDLLIAKLLEFRTGLFKIGFFQIGKQLIGREGTVGCGFICPKSRLAY